MYQALASRYQSNLGSFRCQTKRSTEVSNCNGWSVRCSAQSRSSYSEQVFLPDIVSNSVPSSSSSRSRCLSAHLTIFLICLSASFTSMGDETSGTVPPTKLLERKLACKTRPSLRIRCVGSSVYIRSIVLPLQNFRYVY